ncbi:hypothetical protein QOZ88_19335 [Blastococcus sp. BMG 814]|uniref:Uncharacterized protein n=1 Tax=Blastococcus carthaginiensis TaxID=3050034 RepID=A0ABT9IGT9_9ACTN|nr:hypothetical protein [Blastococcus carthaginiensis]MDP5184792.1 hypothetical protein [Blastococcus carthaginiensis]
MSLTVAELRAQYSVDETPLQRSLAALPGMVGRVRPPGVKIDGDATGVNLAVGQAEKGAGRLTSAFRGAAAGIASAFAFGAVTDFIGGTINAASDLSETVNKSNTIFGQNAAAVNAWARGAARNMGMSRQAALESAAGFGNMFTQIGYTGDQAADLSTKVVQLAADFGSFNNLDTADVADRMSAAFRGEYDSLQALIPNINAARVEQEALAATGKEATSELTAQEKAAAVLAIMHKDGAAAVGDFARTSGSLANQQKSLSGQWQDMQGQLGEKLLPALTTLSGWMLDTGIPALQSFGGWIKDNSSWLLPLAGGVLTVVGVVKTWTAAQLLLNAAMRANPLGIVITVIAGLVAAFVTAYQNSETFRDVVNGAFESVQSVVGNVVGFLIDGFRMILTVWLTIADGIVSGAATAFGWIPGIGDKLEAANTAFDNFKDGILADLDEAAQSAYGFGENTGRNAARGLSSTQQEAFNAGQQVADDMGRGVGAGSGMAYSSGYGVGANAGQGLVDGLRSKQFAVAREAQVLAITAGRQMQGGLQVRSPSRWTMWMGEMLGEGLVLGIRRSEAEVVRAMGHLTGSMTAPVAAGAFTVRPPVMVGGGVAGGAQAGAAAGGGLGGFDSMVRADTINVIEGTPTDLARQLNLEARSRGF